MKKKYLTHIVAAALLLTAASCAVGERGYLIPVGARVIVPAEYDAAALAELRAAAGEPSTRTGRVVELHRPGWLKFGE